MGLVGDTTRVDMDLIRSMDIVENVKRISEPYKKANRKFHPADTVVRVPAKNGTVLIGEGHFTLIAGPCSVESEEQILTIARAVQAADFLRHGGGEDVFAVGVLVFEGMGDPRVFGAARRANDRLVDLLLPPPASNTAATFDGDDEKQSDDK